MRPFRGKFCVGYGDEWQVVQRRTFHFEPRMKWGLANYQAQHPQWIGAEVEKSKRERRIGIERIVATQLVAIES